MFSDGTATYLLVQHRDTDGRWRESNVGHFLFEGLSFEDQRGEVGDRYRELLAPQSASRPLWQRFGVYGYEELPDACAVLAAIRERNPDREFRLVRRTITQRTQPIQELAVRRATRALNLA